MSLFSKEESTRLLSQCSLIPIAKQYSLNFDTSLSIFLKFEADYLLESAESGGGYGQVFFYRERDAKEIRPQRYDCRGLDSRKIGGGSMTGLLVIRLQNSLKKRWKILWNIYKRR